MGVVAGIFSKNHNGNLEHTLKDMLYSQIHRGKGVPVTTVRDDIALGMINKHDTLFCQQNEYQGRSNEIRSNSSVHSFVDGIVLNATGHRKYFESIGIPTPFPASSAVVGSAYHAWGYDFMSHLEGDFSCALWDERKNILALGRDPFGHKPLHYYQDKDRIIFSSEIKGIIKAGITPEIDLLSLSDFLTLNCVPYPSTIFKNIYQVPPGSLVIFNGDKTIVHRYWYPSMAFDYTLSLEQCVHDLEESIKNAIKKRLITDDVYCFLSGGIDSSAVVSFASELSGKPVHAISVGFHEEERNELDDAALMARHVGAEHHQVIAKPDSFFDMLGLMTRHHDAPFTDTSAYPTYYAAQCASGFTDIILTGDGPDQIMGGSGHHVFAAQHNIFSNRNSLVRGFSGLGASTARLLGGDPTPTYISKVHRKLYRESLSPVHAAYDLRSYFPDIAKKFLCCDELWNIHTNDSPYRHPEAWFEVGKNLDDINKYLLADMLFYLPDDLMIKVDRMCMAHGLETLSPFLDTGISSVVNRMPGRYKIFESGDSGIVTKYILKKVIEDRLPHHIYRKKKQGFGVPLKKWLSMNNGENLKEILLDPKTMNRGYFKKESLLKLVDVFIGNKGDYFYPNPNGIVGLITLELCQRYLCDS